MRSDIEEVVHRYASGTSAGAPSEVSADEVWRAVHGAEGRLGAARVHDSARRRWLVEAHRDRGRGRFLVVRPIQGDNEPFRASCDGYRPDAYLRISEPEWTLVALLVWSHDGDEGRADEALRAAALRLVSRVVVEAQHEGIMGAAEDDEES